MSALSPRFPRPRLLRRLGPPLAAALLLGAGASWAAPLRLLPDPATATVRLEAVAGTEEVLRELELQRGQSVFLRTSYAVKRVSVGNPGLVDVVVLGSRELQLVTKGVGSTNVLIWDDQGRTQAAIAVLIGTPALHLERQLQIAFSNPEIQVAAVGDAMVLRGPVASALEAERAHQIANAFFGKEADDRVVNLLDVSGEQQVLLRVVVAEMSRTIAREFGVNFNALLDGGKIRLTGLLDGLTSTTELADTMLLSDAISLAAGFSSFGGLDLLQVFLDLLEERGLTKILAQPTLIARSGESASFLVGGEIPIPVAQGGAFGSITIAYKEFGVGLKFTPTVLSPDRIHLEVAPEVSQPDFAFGTTASGFTIPAFDVRRAATSVEIRHGQTFGIAGLLSEDIRERVAEYPILGRIPILGGFFRSARFEKNETELVILVTPVFAKPLGPEPHRLPTDHFVEPSAFEFYAFGWLEGAGAPEEPQPGGLIGEAGYRISPDMKEATDE